MSPTYVLGLVFAGIILVTVFVKMRNSGLKESYGLWWYWIAFFTALLSLFPPILKWTAFHLGVVVPLNLGLLLLSLRFSVDLSRADEDRRRLTEEAAILRLQVERLERRVEALEGRASSQGESGAPQAASSSHDKAAPQGKKHKKKR